MDAVEAIHVTMNRPECSHWVLDADMRGCFDNMDHAPLWATRPVFTTTLRRWRKAGVVEVGFFSPTDTGTPQGGGISPLWANVALDGRERLVDAEYADGRPTAPAGRTGNNKGIAVMRDADAGVTTAPTQEGLET
jgi:RNA-directed DNA polymerase